MEPDKRDMLLYMLNPPIPFLFLVILLLSPFPFPLPMILMDQQVQLSIVGRYQDNSNYWTVAHSFHMILCLWHLLSIKIRVVFWEFKIISQMCNLIYKWYFPKTWIMTENYCITHFSYICIYLFRTHMHMTKIE